VVLGLVLGKVEGFIDGTELDVNEGSFDKMKDGVAEGFTLGAKDGVPDNNALGIDEGLALGPLCLTGECVKDGSALGANDGPFENDTDGLVDAIMLGFNDLVTDGNALGTVVGLLLGADVTHELHVALHV